MSVLKCNNITRRETIIIFLWWKKLENVNENTCPCRCRLAGAIKNVWCTDISRVIWYGMHIIILWWCVVPKEICVHVWYYNPNKTVFILYTHLYKYIYVFREYNWWWLCKRLLMVPPNPKRYYTQYSRYLPIILISTDRKRI